MILFKKLHSHSRVPVRGTPGSVGYDLFSCSLEPIEVLPMKRAKIPTGVAISLPQGYFAKIEARSGLAVKGGLTVLCGVIDQDYRGPLEIVLFNSGEKTVLVEEGTKIAQLVILPMITQEFFEVKDLSETYRGEKGFGSTGI